MSYFSNVIRDSRLSLNVSSGQTVQKPTDIVESYTQDEFKSSGDLPSHDVMANQQFDSGFSNIDSISEYRQMQSPLSDHTSVNVAEGLSNKDENLPASAIPNKARNNQQTQLRPESAPQNSTTDASLKSHDSKTIKTDKIPLIKTFEGNNNVEPKQSVQNIAIERVESDDKNTSADENRKVNAKDSNQIPQIIAALEPAYLNQNEFGEKHPGYKGKIDKESKFIKGTIDKTGNDSVVTIKQSSSLQAEQLPLSDVRENSNQFNNQAQIASNKLSASEKNHQSDMPQVRIGQINVIVENSAKQAAKTQTQVATADVASRLFLRGL